MSSEPTGPALPIEQSTPGFSNSRIRALPHVHLRSPGSRPSSLRGLNEEFYKKKLKTKKLRRLEDRKSHFAHRVLSSFCVFYGWVCPPRFVTRIARRLLDLSPSSASLVHGVSLTSEVSLWFVVGLSCGVGATRDGPMRPATRGSPPTTKQRRALEPSTQPLPAPNSAAVAPPSSPPPSARPIADSAHRRRPGRSCASKCSS